MAETVLIAAHGLTKTFGQFTAVNGVEFDIHKGEAFGFLGPNGAGKTSTMRMVAALSPRTSGELEVLGHDPSLAGPKVRARLGIIPQEDSLDVDLDVETNLVVYGRFFGLNGAELGDRVNELLDFVQLSDRRKARIQALSGGMKRRLVIARALINRPDVVLLDEPTTGLDPQARQLVWDRLYRLKQQGTTLVLTTHYMDEAEQLCDRLVVMDQGVIATEGAPAELIKQHVPPEVVELRFAGEPPGFFGNEADGADRIEILADRVVMYTNDALALSQRLGTSELPITQSLTRRSTLEDVFLALAGRELTE